MTNKHEPTTLEKMALGAVIGYCAGPVAIVVAVIVFGLIKLFT